MTISIDFLKQMSLKIYDTIHPILGTEEASRKIKKGAGGDISMHIDIIAENIVIDTLKEANVDILLVSEEVGEIYIGNEERARENQSRLIVDPIDGSTNSVRGVPFCCVSIAYAEGNEGLNSITKALIIDLISKDIYTAEKGQGAFLNGGPIQVSERDIDDDTLFEIDFNFKTIIRELQKYESIIRKMHRARIMGSNALSFCLLAKGSIDGFFDLRKSNRIMDIAAGYLIITEAGGKMFSKTGEDFKIKLSLDADIPLIASNARLEPFLKEKLKEINKKN